MPSTIWRRGRRVRPRRRGMSLACPVRAETLPVPIQEGRQLGGCATTLLAPRNGRRRPAFRVERVGAERGDRGVVGGDAEGRPGRALRKLVGKAAAER